LLPVVGNGEAVGLLKREQILLGPESANLRFQFSEELLYDREYQRLALAGRCNRTLIRGHEGDDGRILLRPSLIIADR
jgi:hypothetical protein